MVFINDLLEENQRQRRPSGGAGTGYPSRFRFDLQAGCDYLRQHLIGQETVCQTLCDALAVIKADIADNERPLWSALLAGPTGVGKTSSVKLMAKVLTGSADAYCRIDMNTLSQSHYAAALSGAPPGYVGSKEGVSLFDEAAIKGDFSTPGIVLFDEIEKASDEVILALLNVLEEGRLTLTGAGKTLDFRNSLIFFTTNLGSSSHATAPASRFWSRFSWCSLRSAWNSLRLGRQEKPQASSVHEAIESFFVPEFFNRLDAVLEYQPLSSDSAEQILHLELIRLNRRLAKKSLRLTLSANACKNIIAQGFNDRYGARAVRRVVRDQVETPLAQFIFSDAFSVEPTYAATHIEGDWTNQSIAFSVVAPR
ncbi:AAA family ATPase [Gilvimarinus sp. DA14]|uniref:AAA family ATPase n=1 Tax=Gilvimarinus sp. DA14 TaxID=2956798 RepID=UPI0020B88C02|nr:AAA family ATPase [Gilvimarinus sp. DA14]UTF60024.1 AAA family ATPase [Gilvimarinus sp. DA14]